MSSGAPSDQYRGHAIVEAGGTWVYADTRQPVSTNPCRACGYCGRTNTPEGHDGCIGTLPSVMNACCGHGVEEDAYVQFSNGERVAGRDALIVIALRRGGAPPP